jgi:glutaconate CoA-transferase subunit A
METGINSKIVEITQVSKEVLDKQAARKKNFEYWGPTPKDARKAAVAKKKGLIDKRTTIKEAVDKYIKDGINLGIGGFVNTRVPTAIVWNIVKKGVKDLTLSFQSNSICNEWIAGAMLVSNSKHVSIKRAELAWWGYEIIGIAPLLRYLASNGMIELDDYTNYGMSVRFKAGAMGIPFIPTRDHGGSDMELVNRGAMMKCPFSGDNVYAVPACNPDVGIVHTQACDMYGNARIFGALCTCPEIAQAACHTIMSTEVLLPEEAIRQYPNLTEIPYPVVDAVCEQQFGSWPGAVYGMYWFDMEHFLKFRSLGDEFRKTGNMDGLKRYYDEYFFNCDTWDDFIAKIVPHKKLIDLRNKDRQQPIILT